MARKRSARRQRALRRQKLRQRYRRLRYADPSITFRGRRIDPPYPRTPIEVMREHLAEYVEDECDAHLQGHDGDLHSFELDQLLAQVLELPPPRFRESASATGSSENEATAETRDAARFVESLHAHVDALSHHATDSEALRHSIVTAVGGPARLAAVQSMAAQSGGDAFLRPALLFAPFWVRNPETWDPRDGRTAMEHLFAEHPVPRFLSHAPEDDQQWSRPDRFKWICWLILLGRGVSLKQAGRRFGWSVPRRLVQFLWDAPAELEPRIGCLFAEVRRLGGTPRDFWRLVTNPAFRFDPTESGYDTEDNIYRQSARWLIKHADRVSDEECEVVLNWASHECFERIWIYRSSRPFTFKGRTLRSVLNQAWRYRRLIESYWSGLHWLARGCNWSFSDDASATWSIHELDSGVKLFHECRMLEHSAASYSPRCQRGKSVVVSLRWNTVRCLILEVDPVAGRVLQARGLRNRPPRANEQRVIERWLTEVVRRP